MKSIIILLFFLLFSFNFLSSQSAFNLNVEGNGKISDTLLLGNFQKTEPSDLLNNIHIVGGPTKSSKIGIALQHQFGNSFGELNMGAASLRLGILQNNLIYPALSLTPNTNRATLNADTATINGGLFINPHDGSEQSPSPDLSVEITRGYLSGGGGEFPVSQHELYLLPKISGTNTPGATFPVSYLGNADNRWTYGHFNHLFILNHLGIGTVSPRSNLHVVGADNDGINSAFRVQSGSQIMLIDGNEIDGLFDLTLNHNTDANVYMASGGGNVGVGITSVPSGYKIAINGKVICEEMNVQLSSNWPDYVFQEDYALLPLKDLKQHLKTEKCLPNIPNADIIEKEGLFVGEMQRKTIEKLEEAYLYILQLHQQNLEMEDELATLQEQVQELVNHKK